MNELVKVESWLKEKFGVSEQIMSLYIVGSILHKSLCNVGDVDIVQNIVFVNNYNINLYYTDFINKTSDEFFVHFEKKLHVTTFTQNEKLLFEKFIKLNHALKVL